MAHRMSHHLGRLRFLANQVCALSEEGFQPVQTARRFDIHISTLRYRLDKIQELLACSLDDAEARFQLQAAVRWHRLVEDEATTLRSRCLASGERRHPRSGRLRLHASVLVFSILASQIAIQQVTHRAAQLAGDSPST
jgi:hypothetical protein